MTARPVLIDTHAHLDDEQFAGDVDEVIGRAATIGIGRIVNIGYRPARWETTLALADRFPIVAFTLGLHPHHAEEWSEGCEARLRHLVASRRPVAIGEIGLDYNRNANPAEVQRRVFLRQLELASDVGLPVVIHQRDAEQDVSAILHGLPANVACVLHSFDGSAELATFAIERGYMLGVGGLMTRSKSQPLRDVLAQVPLDNLLLETDSPYLVPAGVKNRRNEPTALVQVAESLSSLLGIPQHEVVDATTANAQRIFGPLLSVQPARGSTDG